LYYQRFINLILAQRLARKVCSECKEEVKLNPEVLVSVGIPAADAPFQKVYKGRGCGRCSGTGYKGRIALYEVMVMTEALKEFVLNGASAAELKRQAIKGGMMTLRASGLSLLKEGITSVEEVLRVTAGD
jgi:type IV pilus assembly protein PilB